MLQATLAHVNIKFEMIKIAHIQLLPLLSGVQRVCLDELIHLDNTKFEKYLICKEPGPLTEEAQKYGIKCFYIPSLVRHISLKNDTKALLSLWKLIRLNRFDIVHTHSSKTGVLGRVAAWLNRTKLIVHTVHGFSFPIAKNKMQYLLFWSMEKIGSLCGDKIICLHENDARIAKEIVKVSDDSIHIIGNGVDVKKFSPYDADKKKSLRKIIAESDDDTLIIGMIGRLWPQKNPMCLLYAVEKIISENTNLKCLFVGDGELHEEMMNFIRHKKLDKNVKLLGWRYDTPNVLNVFDIFVLPSLWEGMPLAILEAKSCALPCVASDIPGNNNIINNYHDGLLFNLDSGPDELYNKIKLLISNPDVRKNIGSAARENILSSHDIEARIEKIQNLYLEYI